MRPLILSLLCLVAAVQQLQAQVHAQAKIGSEVHWSFNPLRRPAKPRIQAPEWPRDPLDAFVKQKLEAEDQKPAQEADRGRFIRRVSLDLTGLPPTPQELSSVLADKSPDAYPKLIDRLLASPRYGERMASDWLDLARYADTYGYQNDVDCRVWPWRDWVIKSFNQNLPYDEFVTWQLAGDLLPEATRDQKLATTFNRLHRQTNEGGSVDEEFRIEYVADRVDTFGMAFLGMTFACARCHDHKFDPISQREYYALSAFFDDIDESGLYSHFTRGVPTPCLLLPTVAQEQQLARLKVEVANQEELVNRIGKSELRLLAHYDLGKIENGKLRNLVPAAPGQANKPGKVSEGPLVIAGQVGRALQFSGENNATFPGIGEFRRWDPFSFSFWIRIKEHTDRAIVLHRSKAWTDAASCGYQALLEDGRLSFSLIHFWPGDAIRLRCTAPIAERTWLHVGITYDGSSRAQGIEIFVDGHTAETEVVRDHLTKDIISGGGLVLTLAQRFRDRGFAGGAIDELKVYSGVLSRVQMKALADGERLPLPPATACQRDAERALQQLRQKLGTLVDKIPSIMTMAESNKPRDAFILKRGSYSERSDQVLPAVPKILGQLDPEKPRNRLALARWLTNPAHPLTARVATNRLWQILFGTGLVATTEDFGTQGSRPTHPKLLDYLACEFIASGYDVKAMLRRIALSATYRQSSRVTANARSRDPDASLLSRYPSHRLSAEAIRDTALFTSGLLFERQGGASVKPYQPLGLWQEKSGRVYKQAKGRDLYRRSLYTFWKRTSPPPSMMIFDAAKREVCIARRQTTGTPLQALVMMNDPQLIEASRVLAERVMQEFSLPRDRIRSIFARLCSRSAYKNELDAMLDLYREQRQEYTRDPSAAKSLLEIGEHRRNKQLNPIDLAALSLVASTILCFDDTVMQR